MADETKSLEILLSYGLDASSIQATTAGVNSTTAALAAQQQQLRSNRMELRELGQVFTVIGLAGAAIYVPAIAASQAYLKAAGQNEALSRAWLADTDKIKQSTIDIGRVVTEGLLPGYNEVAKLVQQFSAFAQANPGLINAAVTVGGALVAIGAGGKIAVDVGRAITDIQLLVNGGMLAAAKIQAGAATTMLAAANIQAGGDVAAVGGDVAVGVGGTAGVAGLAAAGTAAILPIAAVASGVVVLANAAKQVDAHSSIFANIDNWVNSIIDPSHAKYGPGVAQAAQVVTGAPMSAGDVTTGESEELAHMQKLTDIQATYDKGMESEAASYSKQEIDAQLAYNKQQEIELRDHNEQEAQTLQDFQDSQATATRDYMEQEKQAIQDYDQQQADANRNFQESELQAQESYQNEMADLDQSHKDKLQSLSQSHDWLGMAQENKSYDEQKSQKERDYAEADAQRRSQFAQSQADAQRNFEQSREQAADAFKQQQSDAQNNYDKAKKARDAAWAQQKTDEANNYQDEKDTLAANHIANMATLAQNLKDQDKVESDAFTTQMNTLTNVITAAETAANAAFKSYLASMGYTFDKNGVPIAPTHDSGGYFAPGMARNASGANEWVLAPDTVKYAESIVGGRLTQQNLIAAMISGRGGAAGGSYSNSNTVNMSGLTAQDRLLVGSMMNKALQEFARKQLS
jgi:hypothetical protein